jgi:hypothetical protein
MRRKRRVGFLHDGRSQAVGADGDDGLQVMGIGALALALCRREGKRGHARIIDRT